jgi:ABC-type phosphate/phosphonate transport system substrate-binding protein
VSFPIYDLPELRDANAALLDALNGLLREEDVDPSRPSITQICGYPLRTLHRGRYSVLGIPCYGVPGCDGPVHRAFIVVRSSSAAAAVRDLRGSNFAVNSPHSNTGMNLPRRLFASVADGKRFFSRVIVTGSHRASMEAVRSGDADAAAIDCVTFGLHAEYEPAAIRGLRILTHTEPSPSIPFVTSCSTGEGTVEALRRALVNFSTRADFAPVRQALRITGIAVSNEAVYDVLLDYHAEAVALGYPHLA